MLFETFRTLLPNAMTNQPTCLMIRNRPQGADIIKIVKMTNRAFLGYPMMNAGQEHATRDFRTALINSVEISDDDYWREKQAWNKRNPPYGTRQISANRNRVNSLTPGQSIIVIPRPSEGVAYLGTFQKYELVDNPPWGECYLKFREEEKLCINDKASHLRDVVQSLVVDNWVGVDLIKIPSWVRRTMFGRSTTAKFSDLGEMNVFETLSDLKNGEFGTLTPIAPTDTDAIYERLLTHCGPEEFEHLIIALMQLDRPSGHWFHVGGSGDGGIDGMETDDQGKTKTLIQCKWKWNGEDFIACNKPDINKILACLMPREPNVRSDDSDRKIGGKEIAKLVGDHAASLPFAKSIGIQSEP